ncbi:fork head domain-containing protein [Phaeosphaeriaceae sp. PMI808]|nr:fork head domain-containing protein [Phaeosphaeriaceae sp. PMI808]
MPPSSRRSLRNRREVPDAQVHSDADTPDSIATPSRKRRRLNGSQDMTAAATTDAPHIRRAESVASNDSNTTLPNGGDMENPTDPVERQNLVIASLRTPRDYTPNAVVDYANDLQARRNEGKNIAAFAKIAARDWCFFVQDPRVLIGRADSAIRPHPPIAQPDLSGLPLNQAAMNEWGVHIDLGPERQVSRVHAEINFNPQDQVWYIVVNSRNGLKLDDRSLTKGQVEPLHSGICIGIMGTQMLFLLANQEDDFHPMLWRQVRNEDAAESDNDGHQPPKAQQHAHPGGPTPKREHYNPFPPSSHPRNKEQSSQAYYNQMTSTPGRPLPGTPLNFRSDHDPRTKGSPATFSRGMLFDSNDDIDYSHDSSKDLKPLHSYAQLIGQAILSSEEEMLTLSSIYDDIKARYAFFRYTNAGWQNSIRHNLSLNKSFEKVARRTDEPGKGMKWKITDTEREEFIKKQMLNPRKGGGIAIGHRLDGSGPSSPALGHLRDATAQATERLVGALDRDYKMQGRIKSPPRSATPPMSSVPMATESYTPDRGPRPYGGFKQSPSLHNQHNFVTPAKRLNYGNDDVREPNYHRNDNTSRHLESSPSVDPVKPNVSGLKGEAANSPPTLYSDNNTNGNQDTGRINNALVTPLVTRHAPRLAPPSTAQMPSQYINFSSPAPFWKFVDLPSTPARGHLELSPIKLRRPDEKDENDDPAQPSSPPILNDEESGDPEDEDAEDNKVEEDEDVGPESPSRTVSRPVSRREIGPPRSRSNSNVNGFSLVGNGGMVRGASLTSFEEGPEGEEESYDLSK